MPGNHLLNILNLSLLFLFLACTNREGKETSTFVEDSLRQKTIELYHNLSMSTKRAEQFYSQLLQLSDSLRKETRRLTNENKVLVSKASRLERQILKFTQKHKVVKNSKNPMPTGSEEELTSLKTKISRLTKELENVNLQKNLLNQKIEKVKAENEYLAQKRSELRQALENKESLSRVQEVLETKIDTVFVEKPIEKAIVVRDTSESHRLKQGQMRQKEAYRLMLLSKDYLDSIPTLAMALQKAAYEIHQDTIIYNESQRTYKSFFFCQSILKIDQPIRKIDLSLSQLCFSTKNKIYLGNKVFGAKDFSGEYYIDSLKNIKRLNDSLFSIQLSTSSSTAFHSFTFDSASYFWVALKNRKVVLMSSSGKRQQILIGHKKAVVDIDFDEHSRILGSVSGDLEPKVWNFNGKLITRITDQSSEATSVKVIGHQKLLLTGGQDGKVRLWDLNGNLIRVYKKHRGAITDLDYDPTTESIASSSLDSTVVVYGLQGNVTATLKGNRSAVTTVQFDELGELIFTGHENGTIKKWRLLKKESFTEDQLADPIPESFKKNSQIR